MPALLVVPVQECAGPDDQNCLVISSSLLLLLREGEDGLSSRRRAGASASARSRRREWLESASRDLSSNYQIEQLSDPPSGRQAMVRNARRRRRRTTARAFRYAFGRISGLPLWRSTAMMLGRT
jgi:hypothetical protein